MDHGIQVCQKKSYVTWNNCGMVNEGNNNKQHIRVDCNNHEYVISNTPLKID